MKQFLYVCWNCNYVSSFAAIQTRDIDCPICSHKQKLENNAEPVLLPKVKPVGVDIPEIPIVVEPIVEP